MPTKITNKSIDYSSYKKTDLQDLLDRKAISYNKSATKAELVKLVETSAKNEMASTKSSFTKKATEGKTATSKKKRKFKMPTAFTILLAIIMLAMIATWAAPSGFYVGAEYYSAGQLPLGLIDAFMSLGKGFLDAASLIFFLFGIGAFINIIIKSEAMEAALGTSLKKLHNKEMILIPFLVLFFALGGTTYGMAEETLAFYAILVPIFILAGFDAMTGVFVILLGAGVGVLASTVNPFAIGAAVDAAGTGITVGDGMVFRWISWVVFYLAAVGFILWYSHRVKKDISHSYLDEKTRNDHEEWAKSAYNLEQIPKFDWRRITTLVLFGLSLVFMVFVLLPWDAWGITGFVSMSEWIQANVPWLSSSGAWTIGWWYFLELGVFFFLMAIVIGLINKNKEKELVSNAVQGASDMMGVALVISIARGVSVILAGQGGAITGVTDSSGAIVDYAVSAGNYETTLSALIASGQDGLSVAQWTEILGAQTVTYVNPEGAIAYEVVFGDPGAFSSESGITVDLTSTLLNGMSGISNLSFTWYSILVYIIYLPLSFLIPSTSGLAGATMGVMAPLADSAAAGWGVDPNTAVAATITGFAFAEGTINLITPTSGVVMGGLAIARIQYGTFLKAVWKFLLLIVVLSISLMALGSIGDSPLIGL